METRTYVSDSFDFQAIVSPDRGLQFLSQYVLLSLYCLLEYFLV